MLAGLVATEGRVWPLEVTVNKTQESQLQRGDKVRQWSCPPLLRDHAGPVTFSELKVLFNNRFSSSSSCLSENEVYHMVMRGGAP